MKRAHPGYWLLFALGGSATLGLIHICGVDDPLTRPWSAMAAVSAVVTTEVIGRRMGWTSDDAETETGDEASAEIGGVARFALRGMMATALVFVAALVTMGFTDSDAVAWTAAIALVVTGTFGAVGRHAL